MRTLLTIVACTFIIQSSQSQQPHLIVQPFSSVNIGYMFLGNGVTYVSAPVGIAIYRPLNQNFTAFTAATLAPTAFHLTSLYNTPFHNPAYGSGGYTGFGLNAAVSGGLIYTNDAHTVSISGSISVQRGSYPVYAAPARTTARKQY